MKISRNFVNISAAHLVLSWRVSRTALARAATPGSGSASSTRSPPSTRRWNGLNLEVTPGP